MVQLVLQVSLEILLTISVKNVILFVLLVLALQSMNVLLVLIQLISFTSRADQQLKEIVYLNAQNTFMGPPLPKLVKAVTLHVMNALVQLINNAQPALEQLS